MIKAIIFDLDGTLIQTEILKAKSYAKAINSLTKETVPEQTVLDGFKNFVGLSRNEVVAGLVEEFNLELRKNFTRNGADEDIQQWVLSTRLSIYHDMINNIELLSKYFCPFNLELLLSLHKDRFKIALATMSNLNEAEKVLNAIGIKEILDVVMTRDKVSEGKPNPEIYLKVRDLLNVASHECLVIEDSVNGIKAALNAEMKVFAVTNSITHLSVHQSNLLTSKYIIDDANKLKSIVYQFLKVNE